MHIQEVQARIIKNSRGENAIEVIVNKKYKASAPSGASTGKHEVSCFSDKGISFSVDFINKHPHFKNFSLEEFSDLRIFDSFVSILGGNAVVALQGACLQAIAEGNVASYLSSRLKFPIPLGNCIGGGAHSKSFGTDIQEFLLLSKMKSMEDRILLNRYVYDIIGKLTKAKKKTDEGAFVLQKTNEEVFLFLSSILDQMKDYGYSVHLGVDIAASQLYKDRKYYYRNSSQKKKILSRAEQIALVNEWIKKYGLTYVEDPLQEEDFSGFAMVEKKTLVCGDDLITTNIARLKIALKEKSVNSIIIKPNQIGSLVKTKEIVDFCKKKEIQTIISHRSGETMDSIIADLATAWHIPYIKTGIFGKEREVKLQRLVELENR
ncbi:MAG: enolase C-terminal domain-like protein [bacterium]|nr:enolase C-terminal domain-like protein [bacterium]